MLFSKQLSPQTPDTHIITEKYTSPHNDMYSNRHTNTHMHRAPPTFAHMALACMLCQIVLAASPDACWIMQVPSCDALPTSVCDCVCLLLPAKNLKLFHVWKFKIFCFVFFLINIFGRWFFTYYLALPYFTPQLFFLFFFFIPALLCSSDISNFHSSRFLLYLDVTPTPASSLPSHCFMHPSSTCAA